MTNTVSVNDAASAAETSSDMPDNVVTLTDLQNILVVIDLASTRGAFRGPELQPIGQLYDKVDRFVKAAMPPADPAADPAAPTAPAAATSVENIETAPTATDGN
jgi:hypothetical protein